MAERTEVVFTPFSPFEKGQKPASAEFSPTQHTSVKTLLESISERVYSTLEEGTEEPGQKACAQSSGVFRVNR